MVAVGRTASPVLSTWYWSFGNLCLDRMVTYLGDGCRRRSGWVRIDTRRWESMGRVVFYACFRSFHPNHSESDVWKSQPPRRVVQLNVTCKRRGAGDKSADILWSIHLE